MRAMPGRVSHVPDLYPNYRSLQGDGQRAGGEGRPQAQPRHRHMAPPSDRDWN